MSISRLVERQRALYRLRRLIAERDKILAMFPSLALPSELELTPAHPRRRAGDVADDPPPTAAQRPAPLRRSVH
jgi:hypothetical protein